MSRPWCFAARNSDSIACSARSSAQVPPQGPETAQSTHRHRYIQESTLYCSTCPVPGRSRPSPHPREKGSGEESSTRDRGPASDAAATQAGSLLPPMLTLVGGSDAPPPPASAQPQQAHPGCSPGTALPGSRPLCTLRHARHLQPTRKHTHHLSTPPDACLQSVRARLARLGRPPPPILREVQNRNLVKRPKNLHTKFRFWAAKTAQNCDLV
jgi:hypothetical protein